MAFRSFRDAQGVNWEVWDVIPGRLTLSARDHRAGTDRRAAPEGAVSSPRPAESERRLGIDRRASLSPALRGGWLAFRTTAERRRLAPIPDGWENATDAELARYCDTAERVPPPPRP